MKISIREFIRIGILGILLLYSYYYYVKQDNTIVNKLWGNIKPPLKTFYYISMFLTAGGFLLMLAYLYKTNSLSHAQIQQFITALLIIIMVSLFWMPLSIEYIKGNKQSTLLKYLIILVLLIVAFTSLYTVSALKAVKETTYKKSKKLAVYGMTYFFLHTFGLDAITWSYNVL
jgi:hypothetical protein